MANLQNISKIIITHNLASLHFCNWWVNWIVWPIYN